ncbi:twitching motility protein PilT [uncultured Jannaschia sp.]
MSDVVLDASAVLAMLREEPGGDTVGQYIGRAAISTVNL